MNNIIEVHINKVQKRFKKYLSLILRSKYDREIAEELIQTYIEARYYNYGVNDDIKIFYRRIYDALMTKADNMANKKKFDKLVYDKTAIENTLVLFQYLFYFDYVRNNLEIDKVIELISEKRTTRFKTKMQDTDEFISDFYSLIEDNMSETEEALEIYDYSDDFEIDLKRVDNKKNNYFFVNLLYYFEFPEIFSDKAIDEVFNDGIIAEDKLFVEYPMITNMALKDILVGNFNRIYIADFAVSLLKKKKKIEQLLTILANQAAQDKIYLRVKYNEFIENKEGIYALMKRGFKFALVTNERMETLTNDELKILDIFSCIITHETDINKNKYDKSKVLISY